MSAGYAFDWDAYWRDRERDDEWYAPAWWCNECGHPEYVGGPEAFCTRCGAPNEQGPNT
jgi:hypothetical protein